MDLRFHGRNPFLPGTGGTLSIFNRSFSGEIMQSGYVLIGQNYTEQFVIHGEPYTAGVPLSSPFRN